ncbi:hypothetical protein [Streptomyces rochei]|uniref:hypothetical protein n=1 Tax=Streptomyces rochei TaxID=1928 RepID=UPI003D91EC48
MFTPGPAADDPQETAAVVLARPDAGEREQVLQRAAQVREVLTGFRSGSEELAAEGEPRAAYSQVVLLRPLEELVNPPI